MLHKRALHDALALRYGWLHRGVPTHCTCGAQFSVEHNLSCSKGGFAVLRHNKVRDLTANILSEVCHNVCTEPSLQPLTSVQLTGASAITDNAARQDIAVDRFWGDRHERVFFDIGIFNPLARSNNQPIQAYDQMDCARLLSRSWCYCRASLLAFNWASIHSVFRALFSVCRSTSRRVV